MKFLTRTLLPAIFSLALLAACDTGPEEVQIVGGMYTVSSGAGYDAADEASVMLIEANVNSADKSVVFYLEDGTEQKLTITSRAEEQWRGSCATMDSSVLSEVADLAPGTFDLESMQFEGAVLVAGCADDRMTLENTDGSTYLVLDRMEMCGKPEKGTASQTNCG